MCVSLCTAELTISGPEQYAARVEWTLISVGPSVGRVAHRVARAAVVSVLAGGLAACTSQSQGFAGAALQELSVGYVAAGNLEELRRTLTTEPLVYTRSDGEYEPGLAADWLISDDGLTVTLTLVSDATFHDGVSLSSEIVKGLLDAARHDPRQLQNNPSLADIDAVDTVGENVIRLRFRQGGYLRLEGLSMRVVRDVDDTLVGTGPFMVQDQSRDAMTLTANSAYRRGKPAIDVIHVVTYPTVRTAWVAMMRQEVDFLVEVPNRAQDFVSAASDVDVFLVNRPYATVIGFNVDRGPFADNRVRKALNYGVDRRAVIDRALGGNGRPASGISTEHWAFREGERTYTFDPQLADGLLTEAGYGQLNRSISSSGEVSRPARLRFTCLVRENSAFDETVALIVQRQLFDIGVDMQIEALDLPSLFDRIDRQDYEAVLRPQNLSRSLSRLYSLWHSAQPYAVPGYTVADDALDALKEATSREDVQRAAGRFQTILHENPPALFLVDDLQARALSRRFVVPAEPGLDVVETIWQWRVREPAD